MQFCFSLYATISFSSNYKANNTSIFKTNLQSFTLASLLPSFSKSCKNEIYLLEMFVILLSSCCRYNANFKCDHLVFAIHDSPLYLEIDEDDHSPTTHGKLTLNNSHAPTIIGYL